MTQLKRDKIKKLVLAERECMDEKGVAQIVNENIENNENEKIDLYLSFENMEGLSNDESGLWKEIRDTFGRKVGCECRDPRI